MICYEFITVKVLFRQKEVCRAYFFASCVFMEIVGCNTVPEDIAAIKGNELRLGTGIKTRTSDTAFERMDQIGLYAVQWADDITPGVLMPLGNYTDNTCFTLLDLEQDWQGTPPVYYPADNRKLDLYAYYPYRPNAFLPGTTSIGLTVQANQSAYANYTASDFVVAKREGVQRTLDKVNLSFSHKLSQVVFQLKNGDGFTLRQLQNAQVKIKNAVTDARYNLSAGNFALPEVGDTRADITPYGRWSVNPEQDRLVGVKAIVMPQELNMLAYIEITLGERIFYKKFPSPIVLRGGESRVFTITLKNNGGIVPEPDIDCNVSTELNPWEVGAPVEGEADEMEQDVAILTATTINKNISFEVKRKDDITVDWGDGTQDINVFQHNYADKGPHTIKFYGSEVALTDFWAMNCGLISLDMSRSVALDTLHCGANQLTTLDVNKQVALSHLLCGGNLLTVIDVSQNKELRRLECAANQLTNLDIANNLKLEELVCFQNQLTTLDVSRQLNLKYLDCASCNLAYLDLSNNVFLTDLYCMDNRLTVLDIKNNINLISLVCFGNRLNSLDISGIPNIRFVSCSGNLFIDNPSEVLKLANLLPDRTGKQEGSINVSGVNSPWPEIEAVGIIRPIAEPKNWLVH